MATAPDGLDANVVRLTSAMNPLSTSPSSSTSAVVTVPPPTGNAGTDTANALAALNVPAGTTVVFQASPTAVYVINQELPVPAGVHVTGTGWASRRQPGFMPTLQQAPGKNLVCILASRAYLAGLYPTPQYNNGIRQNFGDGAIEIDHLAFDGNNGGTGVGNTAGDGVVVFSIGSKVHDCQFVNIAGSAVCAVDRNYYGTASPLPTFENRIVDNVIINPRNYGVWVTHSTGAFGCTDGYIQGNVVESPSQGLLTTGPVINPGDNRTYEAIRLDNSAGWWIQYNLMRNCPGGACFTNTQWGMRIMDNRVEGFGCAPVPGVRYSAFTMTISANVKTHGGFLSGNIASAYEGLNPTGPSAPSSTNSYIYFDIQMQIENYDHQGWFEHTSNAAFQDSQPPANIPDAQLVKGSKAVSVPAGAAAGSVQTGMSIADGSGLIPLGATVVSVTAGAGSLPDTITMSAAAKGSATEVISFPGPNSIGWYYTNALPGSTMYVLATNEVITGTINPVPQVNGSGTIELIDPATVKDGVFVTGVPGADQVLTASSGAAAGWAGPQGNATVLTSSGTFAIPSGATRLRITCVGGGGGGGGGAAGVAGKTQAGGAGGASGCTSEQEVPVGTNKSLTVSIGAGGSAGAGGTGTGRGSAGGPGGNTAVTATGVLVVAQGGPGGSGSPNGSAVPVEGGAYGGAHGVITSNPTAGCGGLSSASGGAPVSFSPGGGGGGGLSSGSAGGDAGGAGTAINGGVPGPAGASGSSAGSSAAPATTAGAGGGGGGAGASGGGGSGGAGAPGFVVIEVA